MKWSKIKYPVLMALVTVLLLALRVLIQTNHVVQGIFILPILYSIEWFHSRYVITDALLFCICLGAMMAIPVYGKFCRVRRYLLRPLLAVVVIFAISVPMIPMAQAWQEALEDRKQDEKIAYAQQCIAQADEIFYYNLSTHYHISDPSRYPEAIIHCCGYGHDMILVDYDTHSVTFIQGPTNIRDMDTFSLLPVEEEISQQYIQTDIPLDVPGSRLITYFPDLDNPHRTCGITLAMSDGSVYAQKDLVEPSSGFSRFLALHRDLPVAGADNCPFAD